MSLASQQNSPSHAHDDADDKFEWKLGDKLGQGWYGVVYRAMNEETANLISVK